MKAIVVFVLLVVIVCSVQALSSRMLPIGRPIPRGMHSLSEKATKEQRSGIQGGNYRLNNGRVGYRGGSLSDDIIIPSRVNHHVMPLPNRFDSEDLSDRAVTVKNANRSTKKQPSIKGVSRSSNRAGSLSDRVMIRPKPHNGNRGDSLSDRNPSQGLFNTASDIRGGPAKVGRPSTRGGSLSDSAIIRLTPRSGNRGDSLSDRGSHRVHYGGPGGRKGN